MMEEWRQPCRNISPHASTPPCFQRPWTVSSPEERSRCSRRGSHLDQGSQATSSGETPMKDSDSGSEQTASHTQQAYLCQGGKRGQHQDQHRASYSASIDIRQQYRARTSTSTTRPRPLPATNTAADESSTCGSEEASICG